MKENNIIQAYWYLLYFIEANNIKVLSHHLQAFQIEITDQGNMKYEFLYFVNQKLILSNYPTGVLEAEQGTIETARNPVL